MYRLIFSSLSSFFLCLSVLTIIILSFACEKSDSVTIDTIGLSPTLSTGSINPATINTDTINVGGERKPEDMLQLSVKTYARVSHPQGKTEIEDVSARVYKELSSSAVAVISLADDGAGVDSTKDDGLYSGVLTFSSQRSVVGIYWVELSAADPHGFRSNTLLLPLQIVRGNRPPVVSALQAPDTLRISTQSQTLLLTIRATDPDGLADIRQVIFNTFLPDGRPSTGNPFRMFDDGTNGDLQNGDGTYSLRVASPTNLGQYRFEFQAFDRSNASSNLIIHTITVVP